MGLRVVHLPRSVLATSLALLSFYPIDLALGRVWDSSTQIRPVLKIAQNSQTLAEQAKAVSVKIDRDGDGSGVIVGRNNNTYIVLTNWHVVNRPGTYTIGTPDGQSYEIIKKQQLSNLDLAVLYFESTRNYPTAKIGDSSQLKQGDTLSLSGFPSRGLPGFEKRPQQFISNLTIGSLEVSVTGGYTISLGGSATEGLSGSPLLNNQGELVAIYGKAPAFDSFVYAIPISKVLVATKQAKINLYIPDLVATSTPKLAPNPSPIRQESTTLTGAGANFPAPLYERYAKEFSAKNPAIKISYQAIGSGGGVREFIGEKVDFGASDSAMSDSEIAAVNRGVILIPTAGGAISVIYNLPGIHNLRLSRNTLPKIFSGQISNWNDPRIQNDNPGIQLPNLRIMPVVRSDASGTTFIFTFHLSSISDNFKMRIGVSTSPNWNFKSIKSRGNAGITSSVQSTFGTIGYVEYSHINQKSIDVAFLQNRRGAFVSPSIDSANMALETIPFPRNYRIFIGDPADGYPILGLTWMMVYKSYSPSKNNAIKEWIRWVLTEGQKLNKSLGYTRIPPSTAQKIITEVNIMIK